MGLLDLPLEVFRLIVNITMRELGPRPAVALRLVNKLFDDEVVLAFGTLERGCLFPGPPPQRHGSAILFLARILSRRPYATAQFPWNANVSSFLNHILDQLCTTASTDRFEALVALCDHINDHQKPRSDHETWWVYEILAQRMPQASRGVASTTNIKPDLGSHLLPAAILLRHTATYEPLVDAAVAGDQYARAALETPTELLGTPLFAAVKSGQHALVQRLLSEAQLRQVPCGGFCLEGAVKTHDLKMIKLLLGLNANNSSEDVQLAIVLSAQLGHTMIARLLLDHVASTPQDGLVWALNEGMYQAAIHNNEDMIRLLLDHGASATGGVMHYDIFIPAAVTHPMTRVDNISLAAWAGNEARLDYLLARGARVDLNQNILAAIMGNQVGTLRMLLEYQNVRNPASILTLPWARLLLVAIRMGHTAAVSFLILDARVAGDLAVSFQKHPGRWGQLMCVACRHGNIDVFEILVQAGIPIDQPLPATWPGQGWTPMMHALASARTEAGTIVHRLQELGVEPLDVLKTSAREQFEKGILPTKGYTLVSCMPQALATRRPH